MIAGVGAITIGVLLARPPFARGGGKNSFASEPRTCEPATDNQINGFKTDADKTKR